MKQVTALRSNTHIRLRNACLSLFCLSIVIIGCQKGDNGTPGADGATGPQGPAGATGAKGDKGNKGDSGTANVFYSAWFQPAAFVKDTVFDIYRFHADQAAVSITQPVLDSGSVLVFGKLLGYSELIWPATQVSQMPIILTYVRGGTIVTDTWSALASPGNLRIMFVNDNNAYDGIVAQHFFRYIVIPGGVRVTSSANREKQGSTETNSTGQLKTINRKWSAMTYEEICQTLQIPE